MPGEGADGATRPVGVGFPKKRADARVEKNILLVGRDDACFFFFEPPLRRARARFLGARTARARLPVPDASHAHRAAEGRGRGRAPPRDRARGPPRVREDDVREPPLARVPRRARVLVDAHPRARGRGGHARDGDAPRAGAPKPLPPEPHRGPARRAGVGRGVRDRGGATRAVRDAVAGRAGPPPPRARAHDARPRGAHPARRRPRLVAGLPRENHRDVRLRDRARGPPEPSQGRARPRPGPRPPEGEQRRREERRRRVSAKKQKQKRAGKNG